jgi:hypothetical protein
MNIISTSRIKIAAICSHGHKAKAERITVGTIWKKGSMLLVAQLVEALCYKPEGSIPNV